MQTAAKLARRGSQYFSSGATASSSNTGEGVPGQQDDGSGNEVNRPAEIPQPPSPEASCEFALPSVLFHRQKLAYLPFAQSSRRLSAFIHLRVCVCHGLS